MCLVPGMISRAPSRPSGRARKIAGFMIGFTVVLMVLAFGLIISFSIWNVIQNLLFVLYAFFALRPFRKDDSLVLVENVLCFAILAGVSGLLCVFNLVNLATGKQMLMDKLQPWQVYTGIGISGGTILCYLLLSVFAVVLFRDVRETTIEFDQESSPFIPGTHAHTFGGGGAGSGYSSGGFGGYGSGTYQPTGSYAPTQTQTASRPGPAQQQSQKDRFPGKGYKLSG